MKKSVLRTCIKKTTTQYFLSYFQIAASTAHFLTTVPLNITFEDFSI